MLGCRSSRCRSARRSGPAGAPDRGALSASRTKRLLPREMPTPVTGADPGLLDHRAHVLGVLTEAIGTLQRVRCARAARVDGDDTELLAQPLDDRLEHLEAVDDGIDEQQRLLAGCRAGSRRCGRRRAARSRGGAACARCDGAPRRRSPARSRRRSSDWRPRARRSGCAGRPAARAPAGETASSPGSRSAIPRALCANSSAVG